MILGVSLFSCVVQAAPVPVKLLIAGREVTAGGPALADGNEVYVPLQAITAAGAEARRGSHSDAVTIWQGGVRRREIALTKVDGRSLIALSDLAQAVDGTVARGDLEQKAIGTGPPAAGVRIYLLARVTDAHIERGALRVTTSFPVPFHSRVIRGSNPLRGYLDCIGAEVADNFRPPSAASDEHVLKVRTGQNTRDVARIVVETEDGFSLQPCDSAANSTVLVVVGVQHSGLKAGRRPIASQIASAPKATAGRAAGVQSTESSVLNNGIRITVQPGHPDPVPASRAQSPRASRRGSPPARGDWSRSTIPSEVKGVGFATDSDSDFRVSIATTARVHSFVHYAQGANQLVIDLNNAILNLPEGEMADKTCSHRLVSAIHASVLPDTPPTTRVTLDMNRVVGYTVQEEDNRLVLQLRIPRNATGSLADKLIVVDAGHGGVATGASGHGSGAVLYEKDITLALALRLRSALEACGARVVLTRDRDVDVPLYDRPKLANQIGADLFISIHNDSNGSPNSASGTSTYYHMSEPNCRALAVCVQEAVSSVTGLPSRGALSDGILYASGLAVLRTCSCPAILCEVAYINNSNDRRHLIEPDFQTRVASAMCEGLRRYIEDGPSSDRTIPVAPDSSAEPATAPPTDSGDNELGRLRRTE